MEAGPGLGQLSGFPGQGEEGHPATGPPLFMGETDEEGCGHEPGPGEDRKRALLSHAAFSSSTCSSGVSSWGAALQRLQRE